jgi:protein PhnA
MIKDLKVKGSYSVLKVGTKVKNIRLVEGDHDIGSMKLKTEFIKKVQIGVAQWRVRQPI